MSSEPEELDREEPRKSGPFGLVPTRAALDPDLSKGALRLLVLLCSYAGKLRFTWVGQRTLAARLMPKAKAPRRNIQRLLAELEDRSYIKISTKRGKTNGYRILHDPEVDAYVASTPDADTASTNTVEVDAKVSSNWTHFSAEVDAPSAARTDIEQKKEQSEPSRALLSAAPRSSTPDNNEEQRWDTAPKEERVPMSVAFAPGTTTWAEHKEKMRAAKEKATEKEIVDQVLDAELVTEDAR